MLRRFAQSTLAVPFMAVGFVLAGVSAMHCKQFVHLRVGPLYILEFAFLILLIYVVSLGLSMPYREFFRTLWPPIPFFVWGCILLSFDLLTFYFHRESSINRLPQHSLIFVYPMMWSFAGAWMLLANERFTRYMFYVLVAINLIPNFWGEITWNIALGPLAGIPFAVLIRDAMTPGLTRRRRTGTLLAAGACAILFFGPFYHMWQTSFQRTSLLAFLVMLPTLPLLVFHSISKKGMAYMVYGGCIVAFVAILILSTLQQLWPRHSPEYPTFTTHTTQTPLMPSGPSPESAPLSAAPAAEPKPPIASYPPAAPASLSAPPVKKSSFKHLLMERVQHYEDKPIEGSPSSFQMRTRRFMWRTAYADSKKRPFVGIGFIPVVPSYVAPNLPNYGKYENKDSPPVNGPHNSYLTMFVRMGIPGLLLFFIPAGICLAKFLKLLKRTGASFFDLILFYVIINGCIYSLFNVGFESPHRAFALCLAFGVLLARQSCHTALVIPTMPARSL